jgi:hypothetical protein
MTPGTHASKTIKTNGVKHYKRHYKRHAKIGTLGMIMYALMNWVENNKS